MGSNREYARCRREQGEKAARFTSLEQAISSGSRRPSAITQMMDVPLVTDRDRGAIGVNLNADYLAVADTDRSGNFLNT